MIPFQQGTPKKDQQDQRRRRHHNNPQQQPQPQSQSQPYPPQQQQRSLQQPNHYQNQYQHGNSNIRNRLPPSGGSQQQRTAGPHAMSHQQPHSQYHHNGMGVGTGIKVGHTHPQHHSHHNQHHPPSSSSLPPGSHRSLLSKQNQHQQQQQQQQQPQQPPVLEKGRREDRRYRDRRDTRKEIKRDGSSRPNDKKDQLDTAPRVQIKSRHVASTNEKLDGPTLATFPASKTPPPNACPPSPQPRLEPEERTVVPTGSVCKLVSSKFQFMTDNRKFFDDRRSNFKVIGVVGFEGVGKSTIASEIFSSMSGFSFPYPPADPKQNDKIDLRRQRKQESMVFLENQQQYKQQQQQLQGSKNNRKKGGGGDDNLPFSAHHTSGIDLVTTETGDIILDSEALLSPSMMVEMLKDVPPPGSGAGAYDYITAEALLEVKAIRTLCFLLKVCNILIVAQDSNNGPDPYLYELFSLCELLLDTVPDAFEESECDSDYIKKFDKTNNDIEVGDEKGHLTNNNEVLPEKPIKPPYYSDLVFVFNKFDYMESKVSTMRNIQHITTAYMAKSHLPFKGITSKTNGDCAANIILLNRFIKSKANDHFNIDVQNLVDKLGNTPLRMFSPPFSQLDWFRYAEESFAMIKDNKFIAEYANSIKKDFTTKDKK